MSLVVMVTVTLMVSNTGTMAHIPLSQPTPNTTDLQNLMQDYWHWKTQNFPQFTSEVGINDDTAGHLDSYSLAHLEQSKVLCSCHLHNWASKGSKELSGNLHDPQRLS
ncbi:hypothetical protein OTU49_014882 [Cherax quadricarinatus]|uniref:Uncharacterized protein n=1 Tax=Cherax quadricarinatus TaxID=27406 RepID=A0AAW0Y124_CHEQU